MNKLIPLTALVITAATTTLSASIAFTTGTGTYDDSDVVFAPSADVTATNANNYFFRETRAAMQTFVVTDSIDATAINTIVRRAVENAAFTLSLIDFGTDPAANFYTPAEVATAALLGTSNITITGELAFGQASGGIDATLDPYTTMTWNLPSTVSLVPGRTYAFILDGTSAAPGNIVMQFGLGNPYPGGLAYRQEESVSPNFRSGNDYFGGDNNQQADWGLALVAVPEPSTYALLLGAVALGGALIRRRFRS
jgi:hypothetical protein